MQVTFNEAEQEVFCSCKHYERFGLLCRHIFYVLRICKVKQFPKNYICKRWTQNVAPPKSSQCGVILNELCGNKEEAGVVIREIYYKVDYCVSRLLSDSEKLAIYRDNQQELVEKTDVDMGEQPESGSKEFLGALLGMSQPENISVVPPKNVVNKGGGGKRNRITSAREDSINTSNKAPRICRYCGKLGTHDSRNCPLKKKDMASSSGSS